VFWNATHVLATTKKQLFAALIVIALLPAPAGAAELTPIKLGISKLGAMTNVWVASQNGMFKKHGLDLTIEEIPLTSQAIGVLQSKSVDIVLQIPGTGMAGSTPQEVLFLVTDGVQDASIGGKRVQSLIDPTLCTTIKDRGIRIAVLYTTYYPLPTNAWYNQYISPFQANIGPTLQSCASIGLYFEVNVGGDVSAALNALFQKAVSTAYLSK